MNERKILNYIKGASSFEEKREMEKWILSLEENTRRFNALKAKYIASTFEETAKNTDIERAFAKFENRKARPSANILRRLPQTFKYAATIAVLFGLGYFFYPGFYDGKKSQNIPEDAITLELENGNIQVLKEDGSTQVVDNKGNMVGSQEGNKLVYRNEINTEELIYNTLTVPYGKRFDIILSDSTHVLLNAGTSIKYPVKFIKGKDRLVFLTGEAYFDVAKDTEHPFIVHAKGFNTRVLGTQFNISAYPEDETTSTVLIEGSVKVYGSNVADGHDGTILTPGHKASWHKNSNQISVEQADISIYTAWTKGSIVFKHLPFSNITKKLERHYNISIVNNNEELENEVFTASFDVETIEQVFETLKNHYGIEYTINNNKIIINP